jgi:hypothetical protein
LDGGFLHKEAHVVPMVGDAFVICGGEGVIDLSSLLFVENGGHGLESRALTKSAVGRRLSFFCRAGCQQEVIGLLSKKKLAPVI